MNARLRIALLLALALVAVVAAACSSGNGDPAPVSPAATQPPAAAAPSEPTPDPSTPPFDRVSEPAPVESVKVVISDTDPADVSLTVVTLLNSSSCSDFEGFQQTFEGDTITITMTNLVVAPGQLVACTMDIGYVETTIPVRALLTPGQSYNVVINGQLTNGFTVREDTGREMVSAPAPVQSVKVITSDTDITEVSLALVSTLPMGSSCSSFAGYDVARDGSFIRITMTNRQVAPGVLAPCTADLPSIETTIALGNNFAVGQTYRVIVNDMLTNEFTARDPEAQDMKVALAPIEAVEVLILESFPPQYNVVVASRLPLGSSCSRHYGFDVARRFANTIEITVNNLEVTAENVPCTRDLPVVQTTVPLGSDFQSGETYKVIVNGEVTEEFTAQ